MGAALGLALAPPTFTYLTRLVPSGFPTGTHPSLDPRVLLFTAMLLATRVEQPQFDQPSNKPIQPSEPVPPEGITSSTVGPLIDPPKENI